MGMHLAMALTALAALAAAPTAQVRVDSGATDAGVELACTHAAGAEEAVVVFETRIVSS
jgi:hypothetical protein